MEIEVVSLSRQGGREYNEDVFGQWNDGRFVACLVADGAGGHGGGDVAAAIVRQSVLGGFAAAPGLDPEALRGLLDQANRDIVARQAEGGRLAAMRSTVVLAALDLHDNRFAWAHTGDSRAYLFRGGALHARTKDHSMVQQMVDGGLLDDEAARLHPRRNVLASALGSVTDLPEITVTGPMPLEEGDVLLLCSDGLWEPTGDACLLQTLRDSRDAGEWIERIDAQVRANAKPNYDNYTAMVLWTRPESPGDDAAEDEITQLLPAAAGKG
jgi:serine/threonine protein phosphatase PrpC